MFEKKKWRVSSAHKNQKGQVTTVTIATEDETVVRKMLEDPERKKDAGSSKADSMDAKYKTASKEKKVAKQLPASKPKTAKPKKKLSRQLPGTLKKKQAPAIKKKLDESSDRKKKLSRTAVSGTATIQHLSRNLNKMQVEMSDHNSFNGDRGQKIKQDYAQKRKKIEFSGLSKAQKDKLLDKLYKLYSDLIQADSQYYSWMVSGPARYPAAKMTALSNSILEKYSKIDDWWKSIQPQLVDSTKSQKMIDSSKAAERKKEIEIIQAEFERYYKRALEEVPRFQKEGRDIKYSMNVAFAQSYVTKARSFDVGLYKELFEKLNALAKFSKNSNDYKLYKNTIESKVTNEHIEKQKEEANKLIFKNNDYEIRKVNIIAGPRIGIKFIFRPKPQLIYALKSRKYVWHSSSNMWVVKPEKFDLEWAKNISKQYEKYI